jgi:hypothetical protein
MKRILAAGSIAALAALGISAPASAAPADAALLVRQPPPSPATAARVLGPEPIRPLFRTPRDQGEVARRSNRILNGARSRRVDLQVARCSGSRPTCRRALR